MNRREFTALAAGAAVFPVAAQAQQKAMPLIGWAGFGNTSGREGFRQGLRERGYVKGRSIGIEYRSPKDSDANFATSIAELSALNVDVLATAGFPATEAAHRAALAIPVVFVVADPVGSGFVASLARPGGNMTGISLAVEEQFSGKWLELLKEVSPHVSRVAYLWNPANHSSASSWTMMRALGSRRGVSLQSVELHDPKDVDKALEAVTRERAEGLIIDSDAVTGLVQGPIASFAQTQRLPLISVFRRVVEAGGLISYGPNLRELWRLAATQVDKILKGAKPADLPVEEPTAFELVINLKTAKTIGLTVPQSLLLRADEVIE